MTPLYILGIATRLLGTIIKIGSPIEEIKQFNLYIERVILSLSEEEVKTPEFDRCQETMKNNLTLLEEFFLTN